MDELARRRRATVVGGLVSVGLWMLVAGSAAAVSAAATTQTLDTMVPFAATLGDACGAGGQGELVDARGSLHIVSHVTVDSAGGLTLSGVVNAAAVQATGETTGAHYVLALAVPTALHEAAQGQIDQTVVANLHLVGTAGAGSLDVHITVHLTVNANGSVTADVVGISATCS